MALEKILKKFYWDFLNNVRKMFRIFVADIIEPPFGMCSGKGVVGRDKKKIVL